MAARHLPLANGSLRFLLPLVALAALAAGGLPVGEVAAQEAAIQATPSESGGRGGRRGGGRLSREQIEAFRAARNGAARAGQPASEQPKPEGEQPKAEEEKKPEDEAEKKEDVVETIKRPTEKPAADPAELKVAPDKDGLVQFNFRGQPWPDVLDWFAGVAGYSLDWQELPADYLNLSTQRKYTIAETRDLLNRHLLARGFTMLLQGESLSVVKVDKIDPSLVPRVEPDDLDDRSPYEFVRSRFPLPDTMDPAKAVEDVKVLLSPAAKVTPLLASKQLQVIDAVANLRDVRDMLYAEQMALAADIRPRAFPIRYRRADYIADQVMIVLGLDPGSRKNPMELQLEQQRMQLFMQMQQQGKDVTSMLRKDGPPVFVAVDKRRNVVLVNAPPKEMEIIERTIEQFDVPEDGLAAAAGQGPDNRQLTLKRHPTPNVQPDSVVTALKEMGRLDPLTQLQADNRSDVIFAYATEADHQTIEQMIQKLDDGTARSLKVIYLNRRTPADQVAGTINALMVGEKQEDNNSRRYWYYDYGRSSDNQKETFRIQADVENNRLLLWANREELAQVTAMLEDLGAIANNGTNPNRVRVLEARTPRETAELLQRLQQTWSGENPLNIITPQADEVPRTNQREQRPATSEEENRDKITALPPGKSNDVRFEGERDARVDSRSAMSFALLKGQGTSAFRLIADGATTDASAPATDDAAADKSNEAGESSSSDAAAQTSPQTEAGPKASEAPPINVTVTPDGRIILSSDDPAALDQVEDLLAELVPPRRNFEIFHLKNSRASLVSLNLEDYFADELADDMNSYGWWWGNDRGSDDNATLGKRRKLRFIWDNDTNTIVVQNASPAQLQVIRQLIDIYDQPVSEDSVARRRTDIVPIRYSEANDIATAIKEVYRDLLSSKDKEFQGGQSGERERGRDRGYSFWGGSSSQKSTPVQVSFEGALSIGVDLISNSLIISADEQIWDNIHDLAVTLDEKAKPNTVVQVYELSGALNAEELKDVLSAAIAQPWRGGKPSQGSSSRRGGDGDRDRDRYRDWRRGRD